MRQLTATARDQNGAVIAGKVFSWSSSNASVVTVSQSGVVTAVSSGTASIFASTDGVTESAGITVPVEGVGTSPTVVSWTPQGDPAIL